MASHSHEPGAPTVDQAQPTVRQDTLGELCLFCPLSSSRQAKGPPQGLSFSWSGDSERQASPSNARLCGGLPVRPELCPRAKEAPERAGLASSASWATCFLQSRPGASPTASGVVATNPKSCLLSACRGVQQETPVPLPHLLPDGPHLLSGYHQPAAHQRALRAGPVCLGALRAGAVAQNGLLLRRGQGKPTSPVPRTQSATTAALGCSSQPFSKPVLGPTSALLPPVPLGPLARVSPAFCLPQELYLTWVVEARRHILAILQDYPSLRPPIDHLCELLPRLQARYYSIASSSKVGVPALLSALGSRPGPRMEGTALAPSGCTGALSHGPALPQMPGQSARESPSCASSRLDYKTADCSQPRCPEPIRDAAAKGLRRLGCLRGCEQVPSRAPMPRQLRGQGGRRGKGPRARLPHSLLTP